ncbi:hypothetical protein EWM64_g1785 [Hericium alpestre]|uniref:Post-GPI attachment to proteins factor 3 n=1 Tax=Hericium alpestre TaxID=135208 RepID=A0A4Z0A5B1_9AGAM|nr:hypothetical protein EWM64_g1785 [Hericium alpestre]
MRLTFWTCTDDCKYNCTHAITDFAVESGVAIEQYYGKWPFWRFAGAQEPASVVFSLLNLLFHVWGRSEVQNTMSNDHPMKQYYLRWSLISINAWTWSAVFHTRDTSITEKLDYFSAALAIMYSLYFSVIRLFHLYPTKRGTAPTLTSRSHDTPRLLYIWSVACILVYLAHISYLGLAPRFDYAYNMAFGVVLGLLHNFLWLAYALPSSMSIFKRFLYEPKSYRPFYATEAAKAVVLTTAAMGLELFDFPPWKRVIDAHALWHLATAPLVVLWYDFLLMDAQDKGWRAQRL